MLVSMIIVSFSAIICPLDLKKNKDCTIATKFDIILSTSQRKVIDLLKKVCTVSIKTMKVMRVMKE